MQGIMILSFHKKPGAFIDREYPKGITKSIKIDDTEQNKVYSLHRMRNTKPNYLFIKAKGVQIASFYSGFDTRQFIGRPNQCVSIILDSNENPTKWEDQLRRLTYELLPQLFEIRGDEIIMSGLDTDIKYEKFDAILAQKFQDLQNGLVEPMLPGEGEVKVGEGAVVERIQGLKQSNEKKNYGQKSALNATDIENAKNFAMQDQKTSESELDPIAQATKQMEEMEKEGLRNELRNLHEMIQDKDNRIRALESQIRENNISTEGQGSEAIAKVRGEYEALLSSKENELDTWRTKVTELNENNFINQDTIQKMTVMTMQLTEELQNQAQSMMNLRQKVKALEANQEAPSDLTVNEVNTLRSHLAEVEESLKIKMQELQEKTDQNKHIFMKSKNNESLIEDLTVELTELKNSLEPLNVELHTKEQKISTIEENLSQLQEKYNKTQEQLNLAKSQLLQAQDALSNNVEVSTDGVDNTMSQIRILELEDQLSQLHDKLNSSQTMDESGTSSRILEAKINDFEIAIENYKKELVNAKKTIKVQRREIENLQKLLGL